MPLVMNACKMLHEPGSCIIGLGFWGLHGGHKLTTPAATNQDDPSMQALELLR